MSPLATLLRLSTRAALRTALWLWALPLTLCGLPLWLLMRLQMWFQGRPYKKNTVVAQSNIAQAAIVFVAFGEPAAWLLKHHPFGEMDAMAIGCCVFARDAAALARTLPHELVHVEQALRWGVLFPLAYGLCSAWAWAHGRCAYADNYFERQANASV
jgi:hypothetical protein